MFSIAFQILMLASFLALSAVVWRVGSRPSWRIRAVVYGWALFVVWALLWSLLLPIWLNGVMGSDTVSQTYPEGTWVVGFVFGGWFWPLILVEANRYRERRRKMDVPAASKIPLIRLLTAVAVSVIACAFVHLYSWITSLTFERGTSLPTIVEEIVFYSRYALIFPVILLVVGVLLLRKGEATAAVLECLISLAWITALLWILAALLAWQIARVPISN